jgi:RNA polymerase sigma factor (sigma-70 family)
MSATLPAVVEQLLAAPPGPESERAWDEFLAAYSGLLLHAIRRLTSDHDEVMDRYAFVLDALQKDRYARLRKFSTVGRGSFTNWFVAVVRRLCVDEHRSKYGRPQGIRQPTWQAERRQLVELLANELSLERLESPDAAADEILTTREAHEALQSALARLGVADRLLLRLRFEDELSVPEIARLLGVGSAFKVYRDINRLLTTLRAELQAAGIRGAAS